MKEIEEEIPSFNVSLKEVGAFPSSRKAKILWVGIEEGGSNLVELFSTIEDKVSNLGFGKETRKFTPHITFARVKKGKYSLPENIDLSFDSFPINEVALFKSTLTPKGPIYEVLSAIPLRGKH
jgi:2'-5' RNA ligase